MAHTRISQLKEARLPLNLLKMCVGVSEIDELAYRHEVRISRLREAGKTAKLHHVTRNTPRRSAEILEGGSLYWIIRGYVRVRQRIVAIEQLENQEGQYRCGLVLDPTLIRTELQPRRPHQGWRYLEQNEAPADLITGEISHDMPEDMVAELRELGLI